MNKENSDTYSVTCRCPRILIFVLAAALVFGAVCVGGVSGEVIEVSTEQGLRDEVLKGTETIIITADIALRNPNPIVIESGKKITIKSDGESRTISRESNYYIEKENRIEYYAPIFSVSEGGDLIIGESGSGSLILFGGRKSSNWWDALTGKAIVKPGGGAVYVNGGSFTMNEGATITGFGLLGTELAGNGAVYVESGKFTMNGGSITTSVSMMGSGVYVGSGATFEINGGEIKGNGHDGYEIFGIPIVDITYGGGVFVEDDGVLISSGDKTLDKMIHDNLGSPQYVYNNPDKTRYYIVKHFFYDIDGNNPVENDALRQTAAGNWDELTNAKPYSITGYVNDPITQKTIANNIVNGIVDDTKTTVVEVYYRVSISYEITIPANLIIAEDTETGTLPITPTELWILDTGTVVVSVSSENNFNLAYTDDVDSKVSYELKDGDRVIKQNDNVAEFTLANPDAVSISAKLTGHPPYVGTYSDLLTFTAKYVDSAFS